MKTIERILIKVIIVQLGVLLFSQWFLYHFEDIPKLKQIAKYEGVNKNSWTDFMEVFREKN